MDKLTLISGTLFMAADIFAIISLAMPDWIITDVGGDTRLGLMWTCMTLYNRPQVCFTPDLQPEWLLALVCIFVGCICITTTIILLASSHWDRNVVPYARWVGFTAMVLFCLAAVIFPMGFHVDEIGGQPYQLPNSHQVGISYILFVLALWITVISELFAGKLSFTTKQQKCFHRAIFKLKFWLHTSTEPQNADRAHEDCATKKNRAEKILKSFKRTFRRNTSTRDRYRSSIDELRSPEPSVYADYSTSSETNSTTTSTAQQTNSSLSGMKFVHEHDNLSKFGWYWGPMSRRDAENHLSHEVDGAFLVRDSSSDEYIYTLSLRTFGVTLHTHISYSSGTYSLGNTLERSSVPELIESALTISKDAIFSFSVHSNRPPYPIRLLKPVSRNMEVRSLTHLCRFVIRQHWNMNAIQELPLPTTLKEYVLQGQY